MNGYVKVQFTDGGRVYLYMIPDYISPFEIENWVIVESQQPYKNECPFSIARVVNCYPMGYKPDFVPTKYIAGFILDREYVEVQKVYEAKRRKEEEKQIEKGIMNILGTFSIDDKKTALDVLELIANDRG